jgi:hypothetical protein
MFPLQKLLEATLATVLGKYRAKKIARVNYHTQGSEEAFATEIERVIGASHVRVLWIEPSAMFLSLPNPAIPRSVREALQAYDQHVVEKDYPLPTGVDIYRLVLPFGASGFELEGSSYLNGRPITELEWEEIRVGLLPCTGQSN